MIREYLSLLAAKLETVPKEKFDLGSWTNTAGRRDTNECGFTACAGGWACTITEFNTLGLYLSKTYGDRWVPKYGGIIELRALEAFFDLTPFQGAHLFMPRSYAFDEQHDPIAVCKRIYRILCE
jgi:hypothetical protein